MKLISVFAILALLFVANSYTYAGHAISGDASKQIANGIKAELYSLVYLDSQLYQPSLTKPPLTLLRPILSKLRTQREP